MLILQTQVRNRSIKIDIILLAWKKFNFYVNYSSLKFKKFRITKRKLRKKGKKKKTKSFEILRVSKSFLVILRDRSRDRILRPYPYNKVIVRESWRYHICIM